MFSENSLNLPEDIYGIVPKAYDWVHYSSILRMEGKKPVSFEITFVPPHPFMCNMPAKQFIKAESITNAYAEVVNFFKNYGLEFRATNVKRDRL